MPKLKRDSPSRRPLAGRLRSSRVDIAQHRSTQDTIDNSLNAALQLQRRALRRRTGYRRRPSTRVMATLIEGQSKAEKVFVQDGIEQARPVLA